MKILLALGSLIVLSARSGETEKVKVVYELVLNRCNANSCHSDIAVHGQAYVSLEEEDPTFASGYAPVEEKVGSVAYQLRFDLRRVSSGKKVRRSLVIGFSARRGVLTGKQVSWSEKTFSGYDWQAFTMTSTSGAHYSEEQETITPTLQVLQVTAMP